MPEDETGNKIMDAMNDKTGFETLGTVTHESGKRADIEKTPNGKVMYTMFDRDNKMILCGTHDTLRGAGNIVHSIMAQA